MAKNKSLASKLSKAVPGRARVMIALTFVIISVVIYSFSGSERKKLSPESGGKADLAVAPSTQQIKTAKSHTT